MVWLDFGNGYKADYLHLSRVDVKKGQTVKQGTVLGLSGASGLGKERGYGPHLHFSFRKGGKHVAGKGNLDYEAFYKQQPAAPASAAPTAPTAAAAPAAPAPITPTTSKRPTLKGNLTVGSTGAAVKYLQSKIGVTADGSFGPKTKAAVIKWQRKHNLTADGIVGPRTWATL
jgi:pyruvate/2-oxoglutarate dehydrogenase complex dihydrolipoamide acyltransferase (E2) component